MGLRYPIVPVKSAKEKTIFNDFIFNNSPAQKSLEKYKNHSSQQQMKNLSSTKYHHFSKHR